jgi:hypothetical protein
MYAPRYPDVIRFVYEAFKVDKVKKVEKRRNAKRIARLLHEKLGTTTAFVRHLFITSFPHLRMQ